MRKERNTNQDSNTNFRSCLNKGFAMEINGYEISVQWGDGNYVSDMNVRYYRRNNNDEDYTTVPSMKQATWGCVDAEVCIYGREGDTLFNMDDGFHDDQVFMCVKSDTVARMMGCLINCGDDDPRAAIMQIFQAQ